MRKGFMPVLVGAGQSINHWSANDGARAAPSPLSMATQASEAAISDAGEPVRAAIDTVAVVRTIEDSSPFGHPHGENANLPGTLARNLRLQPSTALYSGTGGQTPQAFVSELAARIHTGEAEAVLIAGGEAIGASKIARKQGIDIDWADDADLDFENRKDEKRLLIRPEIKHGMVMPAYFYALFETAIAHREGRGRTEHRAAMSRLFARYSAVAETNPFAQFPEHRSAAFLSTPSEENYEFVDPYLKWHVAQDAVNQGAAIILISEDKADELGIAPSARVYLHGSGAANDTMISQRLKMHRSWAMDTAVADALDQAGKDVADIDLFDLYSCFPSAVFSACTALGLDWETETRPFTVTGGLPYAGGPGNNYSLHGIAAMAQRLREAPSKFGLVLANGGWLTKESVGIYAAERPAAFSAPQPATEQIELIELNPEPGTGRLETYTVVHGRAGPKQAMAFGIAEDGRRFIAVAAPEAIERLRLDDSQIGARVEVSTEAEVNTFRFA